MTDAPCGANLRPATAADGPAIKQMVRRAQLNPFGLSWRRFTVAAGDDGHIVGCVQIKTHGDGSRELASLVVTNACREQGLGSRLVRHVKDSAGPPLWLICRRQLAAYYEQFGFHRVTRAADMPPYFRRIYRLARLFYRLLRRDVALAIMVWAEPETPGGGSCYTTDDERR